MKRDKWIWMPHAGHFICGSDCRFHLNTYVGKYIVSTVGELLPDSGSREIYAKSKGIILEGIGDSRRYDFIRKHGFVEVGCDRLFETMVFKAIKTKDVCCPYKIKPLELDMEGYVTRAEAMTGHYKLCAKWSKR